MSHGDGRLFKAIRPRRRDVTPHVYARSGERGLSLYASRRDKGGGRHPPRRFVKGRAMCAVDPALVPHGPDRPSPTLDRMLKLAGASPDQAVAVAGPASLPALVGLCRKGFSRVSCARTAVCGGADGESDLLLLTGPCTGAALSEALGRTARLLRDGGVLVAHEAGLDDDLLLARRLEAQGLQVDWSVHDLSDACLVALRVRRTSRATASASGELTRAA